MVEAITGLGLDEQRAKIYPLPSAVGPHSLDTIRLASLFRREFSLDWIMELSGLKARHVLAELKQAVKKGDLVETGLGLFRFIDDKRCQELYESLPQQTRDQLGERVVQIILGDDLDDRRKALTLSGQLLRKKNDLEGCGWLIKAGDYFVQEANFQEAIDCYSRAIDDLRGIPDRAVDLLFMETVNKYVNIISARHDSRWTVEILQDALARARALGNRPYQALFNMHLAVSMWQRSRIRLSQQYYNRGTAMARGLDDPKFLKPITTISAFYLTWQGRFRETIKIYETSVQDVEQFPNGRFPLYASIMIAYSYAAIGQVNHALGMLDAIRAHALQIKRYSLVGHTILYIGYILLNLGRLDDVVKQFSALDGDIEKQLDARLRSDLALMRAYIYFRKKEISRSVSYLKNYLKINEKEITYRSINAMIMHICWGTEMGEYPQVGSLNLENEIENTLKGGNILDRGIAYLWQASLEKRDNRPQDQVLKGLEKALGCFKEAGHKLWIAHTKIRMARHYLDVGLEEKAREMAGQSAEIYTSYPELEFPLDLKPLTEDSTTGSSLLEEILQLGLDMVTIRNDRELIRHIVATINRITGAERGAIFMLIPKTTPPEFILRSAKNLTVEDTVHPDFEAAWDVIREVVSGGKGLIRKMHLTESTPDSAPHNLRSCICVPMIIKNEIVGVLYHDNRFLTSAFKETDLKMFTYFAALAAIAMDNAVSYDELQRINRELKREKQFYKELHLENLNFGDFVGESPPIKEVIDNVLKVAESDTTVLISGETGVGKELVAGMIRDHSARKDKPFIKVNCSTFPEGLIASELFGHEKGAFTGASDRRAGRFELADGGTIFLDEIGDIPMEVQVRLLRVLQNQKFERVGGTRTLRSDFRLIAATNQDLQKLVMNGKFRQDLYFRLNVFPIHVPALRERREDIPGLTQYFLKKYAKKNGKPLARILKSEMDKLLAYDWPGNVRELENVIERGLILSPNEQFRVPELTLNRQPGSKRQSGVTLKEVERNHIQWALEQTRWKIRGKGGAAELLDIHYSTLRSRMKKLGIRKRVVTVLL